jgi:hypothetical protein
LPRKIKVRIEKSGCMKLKSSCISMETITRMMTQSTEFQKTFAIYSSDKELLYGIYKELKKISSN